MKSLNGLRTAPRRWQEHFNSVLSATQFEQDMLSPCMCRHVKREIVLTCHVDDLLPIVKKQAVESFFKEPRNKVEVKYADLGTAPSTSRGHYGGQRQRSRSVLAPMTCLVS